MLLNQYVKELCFQCFFNEIDTLKPKKVFDFVFMKKLKIFS
jgi:hypothetical protein